MLVFRYGVFFAFALVACGAGESQNTTAQIPMSATWDASAPSPASTAAPLASAAPREELSPPSGPAYTFSKVDPKVGAVSQVTKEAITKMTVGGKSSVQTESVLATTKVLAASKNVVTELEVSYKDRTMVSLAATSPSPVRGHTYRIAWSLGKHVITDAKGRPPTAAEVDVVSKDFESEVGKPDWMIEAIPARPIHIGEDVAELRAALVTAWSILADGNQLIATDPSVILREVKVNSWTFDVHFTLGSAAAKVAVRLAGQITVRPTSPRPDLINLTGPVELGLAPDNHEVGTMQFTIARTFR